MSVKRIQLPAISYFFFYPAATGSSESDALVPFRPSAVIHSVQIRVALLSMEKTHYGCCHQFSIYFEKQSSNSRCQRAHSSCAGERRANLRRDLIRPDTEPVQLQRFAEHHFTTNAETHINNNQEGRIEALSRHPPQRHITTRIYAHNVNRTQQTPSLLLKKEIPTSWGKKAGIGGRSPAFFV